MASLLGAQNPGVGGSLGGLGGMAGMMGMAQGAAGPTRGGGGAGGFDMSNPVMAQLMLQQAMSMSQTGAPQMQKLLGMYPGVSGGGGGGE